MEGWILYAKWGNPYPRGMRIMRWMHIHHGRIAIRPYVRANSNSPPFEKEPNVGSHITMGE